jgi:hypothetical protein
MCDEVTMSDSRESEIIPAADNSLIEQEDDSGNRECSLLESIVQSIRETMRIHKERRRCIEGERRSAVKKIRDETEINRRYLDHQMEQRREKLESLAHSCQDSIEKAATENLAKILETITVIALAPTATIEFSNCSEDDLHEEETGGER